MGLRTWRRRRKVRRILVGAGQVGRDPVVLGEPVIRGDDLKIGDRLQIWSAHRQTVVSGPGRIRIGNDVFINAGVVVYSEVAVTIGNGVALANEAYVMDTSSHGMEGGAAKAAAVVIGDGSWIGARAIILPGVTIGSRVVVGAGSVVTRDVPDDVLVAGNPARIVRSLTYPAHCLRAWHDVYCYCPGSLRNPWAASAVGGPPAAQDGQLPDARPAQGDRGEDDQQDREAAGDAVGEGG